tara:strand:- start:563 stop:751 length:189 start_codon:yes stop_codon:yes gene_type:complete
MKKFLLISPLLIVSFNIFLPTSRVDAAGCSSHRNKNVDSECLSTDEKCNNFKSMKNKKKVDA